MARVFLLSVLSLFPQAVLAHGQIEGLNDFYNGLLHPLWIPVHILVLLALGLFLGQQGPRRIQVALIATPTAIVAGLTGTLLIPAINIDVYLLIITIVLGLLIVIKPATARLWCTVLAALAGLLVGLDSSQESLTGLSWLVSALGNLLGACLLILYSMGLADYCQGSLWKKTGVRVIGSWVTASAFLVLALSRISS
ncbi:MAG: HupE/UreJ family protein [Endozoicomonas sp.]